jgi:Domain of unknown function (DUF4136)
MPEDNSRTPTRSRIHSWHKQRKLGISAQLESKGLKLVEESENPDLIVVGSGGMKTQTSYNARGMRGISGEIGGITPQQSVTGTVIADIYDLKAKQLVSRGVTQGTFKRQELAEKIGSY